MEFETLKKVNQKYWIIGSVVIVCLASVIFFVSTHANYKVTQKVNVANGIINWSPSDLDVIAIKISSDGTNYTTTDTVPSSGYKLNTEKSVCKLNGTKLNDITIEYQDGYLKLEKLNQKGTKCEFYFDEIAYFNQVLTNKTIEERADFSVVLTENTTGKIYTAQDNDGTSYYYAGAVDNNWVKYGGFYWRIVRINGDGTLRLIYNGTSTDQTGTTTQIGTSKFNASYNDNAYVGYMYGQTGASTYKVTHANTNSSTIKQIIDTWYETNMSGKAYEQYIDTNAGFCGDRSLESGTGVGATYTKYGAYNRLYTNKVPSLKCTNINDLYTTTSSSKGNKALTYPVGLISADEVAYAGGVYGKDNYSYYLYTNQYYWTMSPSDLDDRSTGVINVTSYGSMYRDYRGTIIEYGIRPVINLKTDTQFSKGDGTKTSPFEIA